MKLLSFFRDGQPGIGVLAGDDEVVDLTALGMGSDMIALIEGFDALRGQIAEAVARRTPLLSLATLCMRAPIPLPRRNIFCVGKNYREHAAEFGRSGFDGGATGGSEVPDHPIIFSKLPSAVIGPGAAIDTSLDPHRSVDYEGELAVIIGQGGRVSDQDDPMSFLFGFTIINDVTSRTLQKRHKQWLLGKGIDTFAPMDPVIVTRGDMGALAGLSVKTWVNGELRQSATLDDLIFDVPTLLKKLSVGRSRWNRAISSRPARLPGWA